MENRHATNPTDMKAYTTDRLRKEYLAENLFQEGEITLVHTHQDRVILGGAVPTRHPLKIEAPDTTKTDYFLERREVGIMNIGPTGSVIVDGTPYVLENKDCLYVGQGNREVSVTSKDSTNPAHFYIFSTIAHRACPTRKITLKDVEPFWNGDAQEFNRRSVYNLIHPDGVQSCEIMMGLTVPEPGSTWLTMPPHLHDRRMEVYFYFGLPENARIFHFLGRPEETRHLVVSNEQAVISPPWSIHSSVGTNKYLLIWAMAGENTCYSDQDQVDIRTLR
jgi:4-deoxy-L-threo-5-hexosulose-uronate ketol-isomerase